MKNENQSSLSVVNDIVGAMFNSKFVEELFRPQELYPKKAVKHIFEKLAHSSIMRLNEASMDKVSRQSIVFSVSNTSFTMLCAERDD